MSLSHACECLSRFLFEKWNKPYEWYGVVSIAGENLLRRYKLLRAFRAAEWQAREVYGSE